MGLLIEELDFLREINLWTVILRLLLAVLCGGVVGMEREVHGRAAGLRTHMMVAVGAALTTLIGVFSLDVLEVTWADPMRIGAQVISGIGLRGACTILLKRGNPQITGLTTAAGLWVTAVIGLAVGAGFYEGAVLTALVSLLIFTLVSKLEFLMNSKRQRLFVYIEIDDVNVVSAFADRLGEELSAVEIQVTPPRSGTAGNVGVEALIRIPKNESVSAKLHRLQSLEHVIFALQL